MNSYMDLTRLLREIATKALDGTLAWEAGEGFGEATIIGYIRRDIRRLEALWPPDLDKSPLVEMEQYLDEQRVNFSMVADRALHAGDLLDDHYSAAQAAGSTRTSGLVELLEPETVASSLRQYEQALYREAVFNAFVALFDLIRQRTGLTEDGTALAGRAFSLESPKLVLGDLSTVTGQNEQKGFIQLLQGAYLAIRNPGAHTLAHDLDERKARQLMVMASLFIRRVKEARSVTPGSAA